MRHVHVRAAVLAGVAAFALAACGSSSKSSSPPTTAASSPTTAAAAAANPTTTPGSPVAATAATVALAQNAKIGKQILVDDKGMTLYVWDNDKTPGKASCTGGCATAWPPLYVTSTPTYGTGLNAAMFSTVTGPNGQKQLAVNGKPLYRWSADATAGDATGQNVNGFYVVAANGNKIDES